jgi:acyl carrier protein
VVQPQRNFFDLGGTSLKALQLCERVREHLGVSIGVLDVYRYPTLHELARFIGGHSSIAAVADDGRRRAALRRDRLRR